MKSFPQVICYSVFSKFINSFLKNSSAANPAGWKTRCRTPFASLGLFSPQIELLETRITPAAKPDFALTQANNLTFISQDLSDKVPQQELANACVVTLAPNQDAISQISVELAKHSDLETLRIISHGGDGTLCFGSQVVDQGTVAGRGEEIAAWGRALAPGADILLYGCSVAASVAGQNFVTTLAGLTRADVAASTNSTGAGGDTVLEFTIGAVQSGLQASAEVWNQADLQLPQSGDFTYSSSGSAITITGYTGAGGAVTIPSTIAGLPVKTIGYQTFYYSSTLTSVTIPNSVTSIGEYAFGNCTNLISITIPNSVTSIGHNAFSICISLTSVTIPNSVTSLGTFAFYGCSSLTSVTIPNSVTSIGTYAFSDCSGLTNVTIPNSVISIGDSAFIGCTGLITVTIPNSVTSIGTCAFFGCTELITVTIPNSVISIGDYALSSCPGLTSISVDPANPNYSSTDGILFNKAQTSLIQCPAGKTGAVTIPGTVTSIGKASFRGCTKLTSVPIPNSVTSIGGDAFENCTSLASVTIPNSVNSIASFAFDGCISLTSVTIPNSVASIGDFAFRGCTSLASVTIPSSITSISTYAFRDCTSLTKLYFLGNTPTLGGFAFEGTPATIYYLSGTIGWSTFFGGRPTALFTINTTNIAITNTSIAENTPPNSLVGSLSSTSTVTPGSISNILPSDSFTYTLVSGTGDTDNASFTIAGTSLKLTPSANFEVKSSYSVRLRTTDAGGLSFEKQFTISITNVNEAPTDITLSNGSIAENSGANAVVGTLSSTDVDAGDSFTYTLVSGTGDTDNASFTIAGTSLKLTPSANFEVKSTYSVRVRTTDAGGLSLEKQFTISITNVNEAPVITSGSTGGIEEKSTTSTVSYTATSMDVDTGSTATYSIKPGVGDAALVSINVTTGAVTHKSSAYFALKSSYAFTVVVTDNGNPGLTAEKPITVPVTPKPAPPGFKPNAAVIPFRSPNMDGSMVLKDSSTGNIVMNSFKPFGAFPGGVQTQRGDFKGDGNQSIIMAAGEGGGPHVIIVNPSTQTYEDSFFAYSSAFRGGLYVCVGDVNNDGADDFVTGPNRGGGPHVKVFDGKNKAANGTPKVISEFMAYDPSFTGGVSIALVDVNRDGRLDIVTGTGTGSSPLVRVFDAFSNPSLASGEAVPFTQFTPFAPAFHGGIFVAAGDIDGDGRAEIVTGAGAGGGPLVEIWNPISVRKLNSFYAYAPVFRGGVRVGLTDYNDDGILDIMTGAGPGGGPHVKIFSGFTLDEIAGYFSGVPGDPNGTYVNSGLVNNPR